MNMPLFLAKKSVLIYTYVLYWSTLVTAFAPVPPNTRGLDLGALYESTNAQSSSSTSPQNLSILVISPEGGLGEVTAVETAKLGASVKWFIVQPKQSSSSSSAVRVSFNAQTLASISQNGGSIQFASSDAEALLQTESSSDTSNALQALCTWAGPINGIVCTYDHPLLEEKEDTSLEQEFESPVFIQQRVERTELINAIKVAVQSASDTSMKKGMRVALLPSETKMNLLESPESDQKSEGPFSFLLNNSDKNKVAIPSTIHSALSAGDKYPVATIRYGSLFGSPSSSTDVSPFIGGLRKDPILREEYTMQSIRLDPSSSTFENMYSSSSSSSTSSSSRLSMGEAAAHMVILSDDKNLSLLQGNVDISLTSLKGFNPLTDQDWKDEFTRLNEDLLEEKQSSRRDGLLPSDSQQVIIYKTSFGSVPSKERLAEWIETKWAPTVLRSYDIAGIRVGARPVYATRRSDRKDMVEIVWQDLRDFQTVNVGRMGIQIMDTGIVAFRMGATQKDSVPIASLSGEDILVRRLGDAATQAIEKGLATKPAPKKNVRADRDAANTLSSSTMTASGTVQDDQRIVSASRPPSTVVSPDSSGPRTVGTRRSVERVRGSGNSKGKEDGGESTDASSTTKSWQ